jgi:hypothetical protein
MSIQNSQELLERLKILKNIGDNYPKTGEGIHEVLAKAPGKDIAVTVGSIFNLLALSPDVQRKLLVFFILNMQELVEDLENTLTDTQDEQNIKTEE